jgi:hypothetical protein
LPPLYSALKYITLDEHNHLVIMLLALYRDTAREWRSRLPRSPVVIASSLFYLCGSRFVMELDGPEATAEYVSRASSYIKLTERYRLKWLYDTSMVPRWIIDREVRTCSRRVGKQAQHAVAEVN